MREKILKALNENTFITIDEREPGGESPDYKDALQSAMARALPRVAAADLATIKADPERERALLRGCVPPQRGEVSPAAWEDEPDELFTCDAARLQDYSAVADALVAAVTSVQEAAPWWYRVQLYVSGRLARVDVLGKSTDEAGHGVTLTREREISIHLDTAVLIGGGK